VLSLQRSARRALAATVGPLIKVPALPMGLVYLTRVLRERWTWQSGDVAAKGADGEDLEKGDGSSVVGSQELAGR
jgi:hypothetical protein